MSPESGTLPIDPSIRAAAKWIALILFFLYCVDLVWKLAHWSLYSAGLSRATLAGALILRFIFMAFLLGIYLRERRSTSKVPK